MASKTLKISDLKQFIQNVKSIDGVRHNEDYRMHNDVLTEFNRLVKGWIYVIVQWTHPPDGKKKIISLVCHVIDDKEQLIHYTYGPREVNTKGRIRKIYCPAKKRMTVSYSYRSALAEITKHFRDQE